MKVLQSKVNLWLYFFNVIKGKLIGGAGVPEQEKFFVEHQWKVHFKYCLVVERESDEHSYEFEVHVAVDGVCVEPQKPLVLYDEHSEVQIQ